MNLDIHLDRCDTFGCTCYLEVHVAEEIFESLNISQQYIIIICLTGYKATGNTCYHLLDWNTGSHQ